MYRIFDRTSRILYIFDVSDQRLGLMPAPIGRLIFTAAIVVLFACGLLYALIGELLTGESIR